MLSKLGKEILEFPDWHLGMRGGGMERGWKRRGCGELAVQRPRATGVLASLRGFGEAEHEVEKGEE